MSDETERRERQERLWREVDREFIDTDCYTGRHKLQERVRQALVNVDRSMFVPEHEKSMAWGNYPLPIGCKQTISQPYIVALMTELLDIDSTDRLLEIGTGSGYQTAILAELAAEIYTIERMSELGERSATVLESMGYDNIRFKIADGYDGWPDYAPYNAIIVTAAPSELPAQLLGQLAEGGRMVLPLGPVMGGQQLIRIQKVNGKLVKHNVLPVSFVPMLPGTS